MITTIAYFFGEIKEEHKNLQTYKTKLGTLGMYQSSGYAVEEKGLYIDKNIEEVKNLQMARFDKDPTLARIDLLEAGVKNPIILIRP